MLWLLLIFLLKVSAEDFEDSLDITAVEVREDANASLTTQNEAPASPVTTSTSAETVPHPTLITGVPDLFMTEFNPQERTTQSPKRGPAKKKIDAKLVSQDVTRPPGWKVKLTKSSAKESEGPETKNSGVPKFLQAFKDAIDKELEANPNGDYLEEIVDITEEASGVFDSSQITTTTAPETTTATTTRTVATTVSTTAIAVVVGVVNEVDFLPGDSGPVKLEENPDDKEEIKDKEEIPRAQPPKATVVDATGELRSESTVRNKEFQAKTEETNSSSAKKKGGLIDAEVNALSRGRKRPPTNNSEEFGKKLKKWNHRRLPYRKRTLVVHDVGDDDIRSLPPPPPGATLIQFRKTVSSSGIIRRKRETNPTLVESVDNTTQGAEAEVTGTSIVNSQAEIATVALSQLSANNTTSRLPNYDTRLATRTKSRRNMVDSDVFPDQEVPEPKLLTASVVLDFEEELLSDPPIATEPTTETLQAKAVAQAIPVWQNGQWQNPNLQAQWQGQQQQPYWSPTATNQRPPVYGWSATAGSSQQPQTPYWNQQRPPQPAIHPGQGQIPVPVPGPAAVPQPRPFPTVIPQPTVARVPQGFVTGTLPLPVNQHVATEPRGNVAIPNNPRKQIEIDESVDIVKLGQEFEGPPTIPFVAGPVQDQRTAVLNNPAQIFRPSPPVLPKGSCNGNCDSDYHTRRRINSEGDSPRAARKVLNRDKAEPIDSATSIDLLGRSNSRKSHRLPKVKLPTSMAPLLELSEYPDTVYDDELDQRSTTVTPSRLEHNRFKFDSKSQHFDILEADPMGKPEMVPVGRSSITLDQLLDFAMDAVEARIRSERAEANPGDVAIQAAYSSEDYDYKTAETIVGLPSKIRTNRKSGTPYFKSAQNLMASLYGQVSLVQ